MLRLKQDVLRKSSIGALFTGRSVSESGVGSNQVYRVDGTFGFYDNLGINVYWARSSTTGRTSEDNSYRAQFDYSGDPYGLQLERLMVGANFNPEVGFVRRPDMVRSFAQARFSPRPQGSTIFRKLYWTGWLDYVESGSGRVESRVAAGEFAIDFENGDQFNLRPSTTYEFLPVPLRLTSDLAVPVGGYDYASIEAGYTYAPTRPVASGSVSVERGTFYSGTRRHFLSAKGDSCFRLISLSSQATR